MRAVRSAWTFAGIADASSSAGCATGSVPEHGCELLGVERRTGRPLEDAVEELRRRRGQGRAHELPDRAIGQRGQRQHGRTTSSREPGRVSILDLRPRSDNEHQAGARCCSLPGAPESERTPRPPNAGPRRSGPVVRRARSPRGSDARPRRSRPPAVSWPRPRARRAGRAGPSSTSGGSGPARSGRHPAWRTGSAGRPSRGSRRGRRRSRRAPRTRCRPRRAGSVRSATTRGPAGRRRAGSSSRTSRLLPIPGSATIVTTSTDGVVRERSNSRMSVSSSSSRPTNGVVSAISSPVAWAIGASGCHACIGSARPLRARSPRSSHWKMRAVACCVGSATATPSIGATDCRRAAMFRVSPVAKPSPESGSRSVRTSVSPVQIPIRTWRSRSDARTSSMSRSAARIARSGSSSCADGMPNTPTTASPMNFSTVPPNAWMRRRAIPW